MNIKVIKITAYSYKRSMRVRLPDGFECSCYIPDKLYKELKSFGVITSQQLRYIEGDKK